MRSPARVRASPGPRRAVRLQRERSVHRGDQSPQRAGIEVRIAVGQIDAEVLLDVEQDFDRVQRVDSGVL
jgi:hypothetical protein